MTRGGDRDGDDSFWQEANGESGEQPHVMIDGKRVPLPPWCEHCNPDTRLVATGEGSLARCRKCHPLRRRLLPQYRRCSRCSAIVYATESPHEPCDRHRLADVLRAQYRDRMTEAAELAAEQPAAPMLAIDPPDLDALAVAELGEAITHLRELGTIDRPDPTPDRDAALRELAARQAAESRARYSLTGKRVHAPPAEPEPHPFTEPDDTEPNPDGQAPWPADDSDIPE
jgi:hypothetical protein